IDDAGLPRVGSAAEGQRGAIDWVEIVVPVGASDVDDIAALIASEIPAAAAGTEQRGDEIVFWVAAPDAAGALADTRDAVARWAARGAAVDPARVHSASAMPEAEWRDAWKRYFQVSRLTRQFVVVPSWERFAPGPDDLAIALDPGMAFGTGTHASTRLVLEQLQALADAGAAPDAVLDVGCGSGILAIAAARRWPAARVVAIDNDPLAVAATRDNAAHNRVTIDASDAPLAAIAGAFPVVLANIQAHVLRELLPALIAKTSGTLVLSGLLAAQAAPLAEEFVAAGLRLVAIRPSRDDAAWSAVVLERAT
ncbi:MAG TPA: 50S ribosomal protein L11 methyltransferase, partial [Kofleriaceae bacterium]|nr:50S ribosomal protein L11 methyltransferase [Kofleriaceae bacterium]